MKIRIHDNQNLDLSTVSEMLFMADEQANFNPQSHWILDITEGESENFNHLWEEFNTKHIDLKVRWIGREAVITWLNSNHISFEVLSYSYLDIEKEYLEELQSSSQADTNSNFN